MKDKSLISKLELQRNELNRRIDDLRQKQLTPIHKALIGKCFKYSNSYGSGSPSWWLYVRVKSIRDRIAYCDHFEKDRHGKIVIEKAHMVFHPETRFAAGSGYILIDRTEFDSAKKQIKNEIAHW